MNRLGRFVFILVVLGWLLVGRSTIHASPGNCECEILADGYFSVLTNPHCGGVDYFEYTTEPDDVVCQNWCDNEAYYAGLGMCGYPCDQGAQWHAAQFGYAGCARNYDTGYYACDGYYYGACQ